MVWGREGLARPTLGRAQDNGIRQAVLEGRAGLGGRGGPGAQCARARVAGRLPEKAKAAVNRMAFERVCQGDPARSVRWLVQLGTAGGHWEIGRREGYALRCVGWGRGGAGWGGVGVAAVTCVQGGVGVR